MAVNRTDGGIGMRNSLPWNIPSEMAIFREKTVNSILIMGRSTAEKLPLLRYRTIICLSKQNTKNIDTSEWKNSVIVYNTLEEAILKCEEINTNLFVKKKIFIAGGVDIYNLVFSRYKNLINKVHISVMCGDYDADTYIDMKLLDDFEPCSIVEYELFTHKELRPVDTVV